MTGFQQFFVNIWDSIRITLIENSRWTLYFKGLGTTILTALGAAMIGVIIGLLVAFIDNYHENTGKMTIVNKFAKLYVTV
ncbi:MAG: amino acid ABC transporter permease, partial [Clostridia bacterium]